MAAPCPDDLVQGVALISTIKAAWELRLPQILEEAGVEGLSVAEIATRLSTTFKPSSTHQKNDGLKHKCEESLRRILRFLAAHSLVRCSFLDSDDDDESETYSLPLVPHGDDGEQAPALDLHIWPSLAPRALLNFHPHTLSKWLKLSETVLNGSAAAAAGEEEEGIYTIMKSDPALRRAFDANMVSLSSASIRAICTSKVYDMDPDREARSLADVGGGSGHFAAAIACCYPHLQRVINFDLPSVIAVAPPRPGVEHIQGDMFQSIPSADIIFIKSVLHNWPDEQCIQILQNCHKSLTGCKKLVILDVVHRNTNFEETHISTTRGKLAMDISMLAVFAKNGGKARTKKEWSTILKNAKFENPKFSEIESRSLFSIIEVNID